MENPIKMDEIAVPPFQETYIFNTYFTNLKYGHLGMIPLTNIY